MKNKILIYDDNCPLCTWYSGAFVRFGFLTAKGRKAFSDLDPEILSRIDFGKSRNEIPLVDTKSGLVLYGIDALLEILDLKIPYIKRIGNIRPIKWLLRKFYKFISYNRKVIVAKKCGPGNIDCSPDINYFYRLLFIIISLVINTSMLFPIHSHILNHISVYNLSISELQSAHLIFVIVNCLLALTLKRNKRIEYLGQVTMLALVAILLLIPLFIINQFLISEGLNIIYLTFTAAFIFKEYIRRMDYTGLLLNNKWLASLNLLCLTGFLLYILH